MNEIKKRWHGLRSCALRYFKRKSEHGNVKWAYWSDLSFLRESVAAEETGSEIAWSNQDTGKSELYKFYFYYTEWTSACIFRHNWRIQGHCSRYCFCIFSKLWSFPSVFISYWWIRNHRWGRISSVTSCCSGTRLKRVSEIKLTRGDSIHIGGDYERLVQNSDWVKFRLPPIATFLFDCQTSSNFTLAQLHTFFEPNRHKLE